MRRIVPNEPIIPFTDYVEELYEECGVSSILVIGGSSAYLPYADTVILMEQYLPQIITSQAFLLFRSVVTENEKKIVLDEFSAGIQLKTLSWAMESILTDKEAPSVELMDKLREKIENAFGEENQNRSGRMLATGQRFCSEIRPLDSWCCINRMRETHFDLNRQ